MIIGAPTYVRLPYQVGDDLQPIVLYLIRIAGVVVVGKYSYSLELRFSSGATVRPIATAYHSQPTLTF